MGNVEMANSTVVVVFFIRSNLRVIGEHNNKQNVFAIFVPFLV